MKNINLEDDENMKVHVCLSMDYDQVIHLKRLAKEISAKKDERVTYIDLIRESVKKSHPVDKK